MTKQLRVGIAGLGTVGVGVFTILAEKKALLKQRSGVELVVTAVSARSKKDRGINLTGIAWEGDARALAARADVDVVVELIGGESGIAYDLCKASLANGKHVVTANKAMIAHHGVELAALAEKNDVSLCFEAAVAGGIPIIKALREGLAANNFAHISGILNGTCNYILTTMEATGKDFWMTLAEAQVEGYAETDPSFDIDGIDTAHKLAILTSLAYGTKVNFNGVFIEGIRSITLDDIRYADRLGYRIKLLAHCRQTPHGIAQRVHPAMVKKDHPIAKVDGVFNAIVAQCDEAGKSVYEGRGAGAKPTGSSVVADILDIATGRAYLPFSLAANALQDAKVSPMEEREGAYYIRLLVADRSGVLADIARIFADHQISIKSLIQNAPNNEKNVQVVITTHDAKEKEMVDALAKIGALATVLESPHSIRIEHL